MKTANLSRQRSLWMALFASGVLGFGAAIAAEGAPARAGQTASPPAADAPKPVPPSTAETVDSAFKKLAVGKGHVTKDDAKPLEGFGKVFDAADANHDGRLSLDEFKNAWKAYIASDKSNRG